jgi:acyl-coenzyme A thioesterase PaaI-like protein
MSHYSDKKDEVKVSDTYMPSDAQYEERVRASFARQQFMEFIGAELADIRPGYCEIHLPYKTELTQQHGYFHAGVIGTLADNTGGYAAFT